MTRKRDWADIRDRYITSAISLRDLAREARVPFGSLHKVAKREDWQQARRAVGDRRMALVTREAAKLSLPERSARLRERVVTELETDVAQVSKTQPACLADSQARQDVLSGVVRNAETVLQWNDSKPQPAVRIDVMASMCYVNEQGQVVGSDGIIGRVDVDAYKALPVGGTFEVLPPHPAA